jgi:hypothetical protein
MKTAAQRNGVSVFILTHAYVLQIGLLKSCLHRVFVRRLSLIAAGGPEQQRGNHDKQCDQFGSHQMFLQKTEFKVRQHDGSAAFV